MKKGKNAQNNWQIALQAAIDSGVEIEEIREWLHERSGTRMQPIDRVRWVPLSEVQANNYNPNSVASNEMRLLKLSITADGYTQPVVTFWDAEIGKYVIVDGFHRYTTMRLNADVQAMTGGVLPIVVIDRPIEDRMASTVRHNRARGKHSVQGMSSIVFQMLDKGMTDGEVAEALGLTVEEMVRLKYVTGFAKLFEGVDYQRAWISRREILTAKERANEG